MVVAFAVIVAGTLIGIGISVRRDILRHGVVMVLMRGAECLRQRRLQWAYRKDQREQPI